MVTTLSVYGSLAQQVGGDRVTVESIARGDEDAHFVKPKPSFALMLQKADLFVTTGLDLELWAPVLVDKSGNRKIREGEPGPLGRRRPHLRQPPRPHQPDRRQDDRGQHRGGPGRSRSRRRRGLPAQSRGLPASRVRGALRRRAGGHPRRRDPGRPRLAESADPVPRNAGDGRRTAPGQARRLARPWAARSRR